MNHDFDQKIFYASSSQAIPVFFDPNNMDDVEDENNIDSQQVGLPKTIFYMGQTRPFLFIFVLFSIQWQIRYKL